MCAWHQHADWWGLVGWFVFCGGFLLGVFLGGFVVAALVYLFWFGFFLQNKRKLQVRKPSMEQELSGRRACSRWVSKARSGYLQCFPSHTDQLNTLSFLFLAPHSAHLTSPTAIQQVLLCQIQRWVEKGATECHQALEMCCFMETPGHQPRLGTGTLGPKRFFILWLKQHGRD